MPSEAPEIVPTHDILPPVLSSVSVPLVFRLQELEDMLNRELGTVIYRDDDFEDHDKDNLKIIIRKRERIKLAALERILYTRLPLDFELTYRLPLGIEKSTTFSAVLHLESDLQLLRNWRVETQTDLRKLEWIETPEARLLGININLQGLAEKIFEEKKAGLMEKVDRLAYQKLDLKKPVQKVWRNLTKPIRINQKLQEVWLVAQPQSVVAGQVRGRRAAQEGGQYELLVPLQLKAFVHTDVGARPDTVGPGPLPQLDYDPTLSNRLDFRVRCQVDFRNAAALANRLLTKQAFQVEDQTVQLDSIDMVGSGRKVIVRVDVAEPIQSRVYLQGIPAYDSTAQTVYIDSFNYVVQSEQRFFLAANAWLHDWLLAEVRRELRLPIGPLIKDLPKLIESAIAGTKTGRKLRVHFRDLRIYPEKTMVNNEQLMMRIRAVGQAKVNLRNIGQGDKDARQSTRNKAWP